MPTFPQTSSPATISTTYRLQFFFARLVPGRRIESSLPSFEESLVTALRENGASHSWSLLEVEVLPDRANLVIAVSETASLADAVTQLKARSEAAMGHSVWDSGYVCASVGALDISFAPNRLL